MSRSDGRHVSNNPGAPTSTSFTDGTAVRSAVERARAAQPGWAAQPTRARARAVERFRALLFRRRHEVTQRILDEKGKPAVEAMTTEVLVALDLAHFYARRTAAILGERRFTPRNIALWRKRVTLEQEPYGVVAVISPWNYPFMLPAGVALPALMAGNAVLLKPSELTPRSGLLLGELLHEAGVPDDVMQVLPGDGRTGAALVESAVDKVFFTGSVATGRKVAVMCAERLLPCVLELGGSDPAIVLEDADLDVAASGIAWGRFSNAGQTCVAPKRVIVVDAVYDAFLQRFTAAARALRMGDALAPDTDVAPMINASQATALASQLEDALARGARSVVGVGGVGGVGRTVAEEVRGASFAPTVLVDVPPDARVLEEETFGPLAPVVRARDADDAVRLANATGFGLSASVWGRDRQRTMAVARRLTAGSVTVNDAVVAVGIAEVPHGGAKASGFGRSHGVEGLLECVRPKAIIADRLPSVRQPWWFGYTARHAGDIDAFVRLTHGRSVRERASGIWRSVRMLFVHERPV